MCTVAPAALVDTENVAGHNSGGVPTDKDPAVVDVAGFGELDPAGDTEIPAGERKDVSHVHTTIVLSCDTDRTACDAGVWYEDRGVEELAVGRPDAIERDFPSSLIKLPVSDWRLSGRGGEGAEE